MRKKQKHQQYDTISSSMRRYWLTIRIYAPRTSNWYGLGPVSVLPKYQRMGIGKALIQEGLARLKKLCAKGCCLVGYPQYYRKFGFENVAGLVHEDVPQEVFFALSFDGRFPRGTVTFHEGFRANRH